MAVFGSLSGQPDESLWTHSRGSLWNSPAVIGCTEPGGRVCEGEWAVRELFGKRTN